MMGDARRRGTLVQRIAQSEARGGPKNPTPVARSFMVRKCLMSLVTPPYCGVQFRVTESDPDQRMCAAHWKLVPAELRAKLLASERRMVPSQRHSSKPSKDWQLAAQAAVLSVLQHGRPAVSLDDMKPSPAAGADRHDTVDTPDTHQADASGSTEPVVAN